MKIMNKASIAELRDSVHGLNVWHDTTLDRFIFKNDGNLHGAIAECMEDLAAHPENAKKWESDNAKYSHYDLTEIAKHQRGQQALDLMNEQMLVARSMKTFGGSFVDELGKALFLADPENAARIKTAFPEYWEKYLGLGKKLDEDGNKLPEVHVAADLEPDEEYEKDDDGCSQSENHWDQREHYREM